MALKSTKAGFILNQNGIFWTPPFTGCSGLSRQEEGSMRFMLVILLSLLFYSAEAAVFVGCFKDTADRDLKGYSFSSRQMTVQDCIFMCAHKGYAYAGLQYGSQCFCGNSYGRYGAVNNCNMRCSGDSSQVCGGFWANSVYRIRGVGGPVAAGPEGWFSHWKIISKPSWRIARSSEGWGWKCPPRDIGDAMPPAGGKGCVLYLHPVSRTQPAVLRGSYRVYGEGVLIFRVAGNRNGDWVMVVKVNGYPVKRVVVDGRGWHDVRVPVKGNGLVDVEMDIQANGWYFEYAFIDEVRFVGGAGY